MRLYGIKNCDTCRKALKKIENEGLSVTFVDVREQPLDPETLDRFLTAFGEKLINQRSTTWRGLSEEARAQTPSALLTAHPTLMKRPVIETAGALYLGWKTDVQSALLG